MIDIIYLLVSILFFALMLGYVRACERLGRTPASDIDSRGESNQ